MNLTDTSKNYVQINYNEDIILKTRNNTYNIGSEKCQNLLVINNDMTLEDKLIVQLVRKCSTNPTVFNFFDCDKLKADELKAIILDLHNTAILRSNRIKEIDCNSLLEYNEKTLNNFDKYNKEIVLLSGFTKNQIFPLSTYLKDLCNLTMLSGISLVCTTESFEEELDADFINSFVMHKGSTSYI